MDRTKQRRGSRERGGGLVRQNGKKEYGLKKCREAEEKVERKGNPLTLQVAVIRRRLVPREGSTGH